MITAGLVFKDGEKGLANKFKKTAPALQSRMEAALMRLAIKLSAHVKADKLSGQVLKNRTGRLRRSINFKIQGQGTNSLIASVGTNVQYARAHEYGGSVTVKEHLRMMTQAWGRAVKNPRMISVQAHQANYPERSFLRSALRDMEAEIRAELTSTMRKVVIEGLK